MTTPDDGVDPEEVRARAAAEAIAQGLDVNSSELQLIRKKLRVRLNHYFGDISTAEVDDVIDASIEKFLLAVGSGRVEPATALAYLRKIAVNKGIDQMRSRRREIAMPEGFEEEPASDDAVAKMIDADANASAVENILAIAAREHDHTTTKVINAFLNLAQTGGRTPSYRLVAVHSDVSHTTVRTVLLRLRSQLQQDHFPDRPYNS